MGASVVYEPFIQYFSNENTIIVAHNFGRKVNVSVYEYGQTGDYDQEIICDIYNISLNIITVKFFENDSLVNKSGYIVVS